MLELSFRMVRAVRFLGGGVSKRKPKATEEQRAYVAKLYPGMRSKRLLKLNKEEASRLIDEKKHTVDGLPDKKEKVWGDTVSLASSGGMIRQIRIEEEGERATEGQVTCLERVRPDIPESTLPRLSKRQAYKLIEAAKKKEKRTTASTRGNTSVLAGASGGSRRANHGR